MNTIKVATSELIGIIKDNRTTHITEFKEAVESYQQEVVEVLEEGLRKAKAGKKYITSFHVQKPESHEDDYDTIIGMLELSVDETVTLDHNQYKQYVQNVWFWSDTFNSTKAYYQGKLGK